MSNTIQNINKKYIALAPHKSIGRDCLRWQKYSSIDFIFFNFYLTIVHLTNGQHFFYTSYLPRYREYEDDFFRNIMWDIMDDPVPMETILTYIRRYGPLPRFLLMRIYFYEAKKKRRWYADVERTMDKHIARIIVRIQKATYFTDTSWLEAGPEGQ
jgi:hypothetical protein